MFFPTTLSPTLMDLTVGVLLGTFILSVLALFVFIASMAKGLFGSGGAASVQIFDADEVGKVEDPAATQSQRGSLQQAMDPSQMDTQRNSEEVATYGDQRTVSTLRPAVVRAGAAEVDGKQIYGAKCVACHQASGLGVAGVFPPLAGAEWVLGDEKVLASILLHGVNGELVVKGTTYNGAMPAFGTLPDEEIAAVLTHIRSEWGNKASPITAATIAAQREATKAQSGPYAGGAALTALAP